MAITRTQIAKQLLANGGRIGLKGGADAATESFSKSAGSSKGRKGSVSVSPSGNVTFNPGGKDDAPTTYIGGKEYEVLDTNVKERQEAEEVAQARRLAARNEFINRPPKPINTPFPLINTGLNAAQKFLPYKVTRRFYADDVVGRTVTLPDGTTVTYGLDNYDEYDQLRKEGIINAYGRPLTDAERSRFDDDSNDNNFIPVDTTFAQAPGDTDQGTETEEDPFRLALAFRKDGGRIGAAEGGIMDIARQEMFLGGVADAIGKGLKKATRAVKKVVKSPIGKAALVAGLGYGLGGGTFFGKMLPGVTRGGQGFGGFGGLSAIFGNVGDIIGGTGLGDKFAKAAGSKIGLGIAGASVLAGLLTPQQEEEAQLLADNTGIDIEEARNSILAAARDNYKMDFRARGFKADGGIMRLGYQEGSKEPVAKKTMPLLDMGGKEMDLREDGGFVPIGRMEKADDVPARLSKNEFVFTADAVRNAGDGNVDKGAEVMYNMMKNLESGGDVSEESQGLEGARRMFQTSQRLEEVI